MSSTRRLVHTFRRTWCGALKNGAYVLLPEGLRSRQNEARRLKRQGVSDTFLKQAPLGELRKAIRITMASETFMDPSFAGSPQKAPVEEPCHSVEPVAEDRRAHPQAIWCGWCLNSTNRSCRGRAKVDSPATRKFTGPRRGKFYFPEARSVLALRSGTMF